MMTCKVLFCNLDPQTSLAETLKKMLAAAGSVEFEDFLPESPPPQGENASTQLSNPPDLTFLVSRANSPSKIIPCLESLRARRMECPVIGVIDDLDSREMLGLLHAGLSDFLIPPLRETEVRQILGRWTQGLRPSDVSFQQLKEKLGLQHIIGESPLLVAEIEKIALCAQSPYAPVLITGSSGTGKNVAAQAIHYLSGRSGHPFLSHNCGSLPLDLLESELFGHVRGAFTGAVSDKPGLLQRADGGTVFLDELGAAPLPAQVKLLTFLQDKHFTPLGSTKVCTVDVRILAATNADVEAAVQRGQLRDDLYHRLNVLRIHMPQLRERAGDVALLARAFLAQFAKIEGKDMKALTPAALEKLNNYDWPGNVRELENVLHRVVVFSQKSIIQAHEIEWDKPAVKIHFPGFKSYKKEKAALNQDFEEGAITKSLQAFKGNISKAAKALGMSLRQFRRLLRKHHIGRQRPAA